VIERAESVPYVGCTGLPYLVAPPKGPTDKLVTEPHHVHFSPARKAYFMQLGPFGPAVMDSYLQRVESRHHVSRGNSNPSTQTIHDTFRRTKVAQRSRGQIRQIFFGVQKAVSHDVIDFDEGCLRPITNHERRRLFNSGEVFCAKRQTRIREAMVRFSVREGLEAVSGAELVTCDNILRRSCRKMATPDECLRKMVKHAFRQFADDFQEAKERKLIPLDSPPDPADIVQPFVDNESRRFQILKEELDIALGRKEPPTLAVANVG